jgi:4'-phosphopantetheinyl transferase EntD
MMDRLLPAWVAVAEATEADWNARLLPEEAAPVARAVDRRRREFAAGRACARRALAGLGFEPGPIPSGRDRAPVWPAGVIGSITHCPGYCAAAVARLGDLLGLGIDAEVNRPLPQGVGEIVCTERELAWSEAQDCDAMPWRTVIFSAKESVYKAWQPLTGEWLGYLDAELSIDQARGCFEATLLVAPHAALGRDFAGFRGRFAVTPDHVLTAATLPTPV